MRHRDEHSDQKDLTEGENEIQWAFVCGPASGGCEYKYALFIPRSIVKEMSLKRHWAIWWRREQQQCEDVAHCMFSGVTRRKEIYWVSLDGLSEGATEPDSLNFILDYDK